MIPSNLNSDSILNNINTTEPPDLTFKIVNGEMLVGKVDELEAVKQTIAVMLSVERYEHLIYSWDYGVELEDLIGEDVAFACPKIASRITEALKQDSRIKDVDGWSFERHGSVVTATFTVHTIYGDAEISKEVNI